jgi:hypothetical protein
MSISRCRSLGLLLAAILSFWNGLSNGAWTAEGFHREGYDVRQRAEDDAKGNERRDEEAVARSREPWRGQDLTNRPKAEFHDANALEARIEAQKKANQWKINQAEHAWERRGDSEFRNLGITDSRQLQLHAENIRSHPDLKKELEGGRMAYGQFHEVGGMKGTIVIDNPKADNGGTIMTHNDIRRRMEGLN